MSSRADQRTPTQALSSSDVNNVAQTPFKCDRPATHSGWQRTTHAIADAHTSGDIHSLVNKVKPMPRPTSSSSSGTVPHGPVPVGGVHRTGGASSSGSLKRRNDEMQQTFADFQVSGRSPQQGSSMSPMGGRFVDPSPGGSPNIAYPYSDVHYSTASVVRPSQEFSTLSNADTEISIFTRRILTEFAEVSDLGSGCFGTVLLCEERLSGGFYAVKVSREAQWKEDLTRLRHERDILAAVRGFPHVIYLHASWEEGKKVRMYLQLQYCSGGALNQMIAKRRFQRVAWQEVEVLTILAQMAMALDALHSVHIAHVDVKPDNILIDDTGSFVLSDFGNSLTLDANTGRPHNFFHRSPSLVRPDLSVGQSTASQPEGDCRYVSADMLNEKRFYKAGDIFSLGISMFELMSGEELPTSGQRYHDLRNSATLPLLRELGYSPGLVQLVERMMNIEPSARPSARQILEFVNLRPSSGALSLTSRSSEAVVGMVASGAVAIEQVQFHKTCFEVSHYLLDAAIRTHLNVVPPTCKRLFKSECTAAQLVQGATPTDVSMTPSSSLKTPVLKALGTTPSFRTPTSKAPR